MLVNFLLLLLVMSPKLIGLIWFGFKVDWFDLVGQDRMKKWKVSNDFNCAFYNGHVDSHSHLFFYCNFPMEVWNLVKLKVNIKHKPGSWFEIIQELQVSLKSKNIGNFIKKMALAASIYHIWKEKNKKLFGREINFVDKLVKIILEDIIYKMFSLKLEYVIQIIWNCSIQVKLLRIRVGSNKNWFIKMWLKGYFQHLLGKMNIGEIIGGYWFNCMYLEEVIFESRRRKKCEACDWNFVCLIKRFLSFVEEKGNTPR